MAAINRAVVANRKLNLEEEDTNRTRETGEEV